VSEEIRYVPPRPYGPGEIQARFRRSLGLPDPARRGAAGNREPAGDVAGPDTFVVVMEFELACRRREAAPGEPRAEERT